MDKEEETPPTPRRRSSLASKKRMTLHLQRLANEHDIAPDADDRHEPAIKKHSFTPSVPSAVSVKGVVQLEEPVSLYFRLTTVVIRDGHGLG